ncbi:MAG: uL15m family ribosomal protein [Candidatus Hodarchaeales archaeon]
MVIKRRSKKNWKYRGKRTRGYGRISGGHRKAGQRGGVGGAGLKDHHWIKSIKEGFRSPFGFTRHHDGLKTSKSINVGQLDDIVNEMASKGTLEPKDGVFTLDLEEIGYNKLLGGGIVKSKMIITLDKCSERAREKIESAGGSITIKTE